MINGKLYKWFKRWCVDRLCLFKKKISKKRVNDQKANCYSIVCLFYVKNKGVNNKLWEVVIVVEKAVLQ